MAVAFVATIVLIRPWTGNVAITEVSAVGTAQIQVAERPPMNHPTQEALQDVREERNPALQKSGPPDTEAEASAAASAERAAQAAADLAANQ
jgi:hypothetical protein